jgi:hypothetical protein
MEFFCHNPCGLSFYFVTVKSVFGKSASRELFPGRKSGRPDLSSTGRRFDFRVNCQELSRACFISSLFRLNRETQGKKQPNEWTIL